VFYDTLILHLPLDGDLQKQGLASRSQYANLQAGGRGFESHHLHHRRWNCPRFCGETSSAHPDVAAPVPTGTREGTLAFPPSSKATIVFGEEFLYELKAGPAGGRLRRPSSAGSPTRAARPDHNRLHQARVMPTAVAQTARESRPTV
jgi:hypothetical protein